MKIKKLIPMIAPLLLGGCSLFGIRSGYEQPDHTVIETIGEDVEVRAYASRLAAETIVDATDPETGRNAAFRILFDYISGENSAQTDIAMTTPVETAAGTSASSESIAMTAPVETAPMADGQLAMRFFLPAEYVKETAPIPTDPRVRIFEIPEATLAVVRFTGSTTVETIDEYKAELLRTTASSAWRTLGIPVTLFYDPPWTLPFLRRNEVAVRVERRS